MKYVLYKTNKRFDCKVYYISYELGMINCSASLNRAKLFDSIDEAQKVKQRVLNKFYKVESFNPQPQ